MALCAVVDRDPSGLLFTPQVIEATPSTGGKVIAEGEPERSLTLATKAAEALRRQIVTARGRKESR